MDINMPKMNGIKSTRRLSEEMPSIAVIALSMHEDKSAVAAANEAVAVANTPKGLPPRDCPERFARLIASLSNVPDRRPSAPDEIVASAMLS